MISHDQLRVDVNLQVKGEKYAGPVVDIKNLQSPKSIESAVEHEYLRQIDLLNNG